MNAIDLLKNDHQTVQHLFAEYISTDESETDRREDLFQQIEKELLAHTDVEEGIFYPAIKNIAPDLIEQAISEHQEVTRLLTEMLEYEVDDEEFDKRMNNLMETVQMHVQEEEGAGGVMDIASQKLAGQLEEMGKQIQQRKESADEEQAA
ncbi:MAG TPA: hemerythrin domain-containing protein [Terriglobia bacterium]|nr:hemerythrin domain-containing protein [Terriglobia bacterium]